MQSRETSLVIPILIKNHPKIQNFKITTRKIILIHNIRYRLKINCRIDIVPP